MPPSDPSEARGATERTAASSRTGRVDPPAGRVEPLPEESDGRPQPDAGRDRRTTFGIVSVGGLFILALLGALYAARSFLVPIVLARLLAFFLQPGVRMLRSIRIPAAVASALVLVLALGIVAGAVYELAMPARSWLARVPEGLREVEARSRVLQQPLLGIARTAERIERIGTAGQEPAPEVAIQGPSPGRVLFGGTMGFLSSLVIVLFLTYFLLLFDDRLLQKLVKVLPQLKDKKRAVSIVREVQQNISVYLLNVTAINLGVGVLTVIATWLLGMPNPLLWGAIAAILNYVPYFGAIGTVAILAFAGMLHFESLGRALLVPGSFLLINLAEAYLATPLIHSRRLTLNPLAVFLSLLFWWFLWGIPGALLAIPMVAVLKIFCDHFETLAPIGEFLGE